MHKQKIGIWGLGAVGASAIEYFKPKNIDIEILDLREPSHPTIQTIPHQVRYTQQSDTASIQSFFERNDAIIVSPGIDTQPYAQFAHKVISELDILAQSTTTPLIGITGTVGKTTVTSLLSHYLQQLGFSVGTGGNIGTPMLNLLKNSTANDYLVLELSSFQLEYTKQCAPQLAIWTNFYSNHLDRHRTVSDYFLAKWNVVAHQKTGQHTLLPLSILPMIKKHGKNIEKISTHLSFFSLEKPQQENGITNAQIFYIENNNIVVQKNEVIIPIISLSQIAFKTYPENMLILSAALHCLNRPVNILTQPNTATTFEHRLEHVATHNNTAFYNDSKATIMQATFAAVQTLAGQQITLLLGGLSKGVDRSIEIEKLSGNVEQIICFGKEAKQLYQACKNAQINGQFAQTLEQAFELAIQNTSQNRTVLLSPGGASFDLFANYSERGKRFKELVAQHVSLQQKV